MEAGPLEHRVDLRSGDADETRRAASSVRPAGLAEGLPQAAARRPRLSGRSNALFIGHLDGGGTGTASGEMTSSVQRLFPGEWKDDCAIRVARGVRCRSAESSLHVTYSATPVSSCVSSGRSHSCAAASLSCRAAVRRFSPASRRLLLG